MENKLEELINRIVRDGKSIMVATPCYNGQVYADYSRSMVFLSSLCARAGIELHIFFHSDSLITRARNYCADVFLQSPCNVMVFIDADIQFNPIDVLQIVDLTDPKENRDVVCGPYPLKDISWEKIKYAVDKGYADKNSDELVKYSVDYVFNMATNAKSFKVSELVEVMESGTGFMSIDRTVFERFAEAHPELSYIPDHLRSENFNGSREITAFFNDPIDPVSKRFLSEDYYFCQEIAKLGMKTWVAPWIQLNHLGTYKFYGNLVDQAKAGLSYGVMKGKLQ